MNKTEITGLINVLNVPGLGSQKARQLVTKFPSPKDIFNAPTKDLCSVPGIKIKTANAIHGYSDFDFGKKEVEKSENFKITFSTFWDDTYPFLLKKIFDPPALLYIKGNPLISREDSVAVVGTRSPTPYGRSVTKKFTEYLVNKGLTIISGLARGIDTNAHKTTLKLGGRTIAVLGSGIDVIYPSENKNVADSIIESGTIISEFPFGKKPEAGNFPKRNRIISGLSHGVLVVEAGNKSGAILTALNAVDQNRDVFVIPGRISDTKSTGCNRLIKHGGMLVDSGNEIFTTIQPKLFNPTESRQTELAIKLTKPERSLISLLSSDPVHIDELSEKANISVTHLLTQLLNLELKGVVHQLSGKQFISVI